MIVSTLETVGIGTGETVDGVGGRYTIGMSADSADGDVEGTL